MRRSSSLPPDWAFPDYEPEEEPVASVARSLKAAKTEVSPAVPDGTTIALRCLADVQEEPLEWVLDDVIPRGALTLITGESGVGKSRLAVGLIAAVIAGQPGPRHGISLAGEKEAPTASPEDRGDQTGVSPRTGDGPTDTPACDAEKEPLILTFSPEDRGEGTSDPHRANGDQFRNPSCDADKPPVAGAGAAVVFSSEQMLADTIRPRLIEAGTDLSHVYALCGVDDAVLKDSKPDVPNEDACDVVSTSRGLRHWSFQLDRDLPVLEVELRRLQSDGVNVRMIVIDPVDSYLDSTRRRSLVAADVSKLTELASRTGVAIVAISNSSPSAMLRSTRRSGAGGDRSLVSLRSSGLDDRA